MPEDNSVEPMRRMNTENLHTDKVKVNFDLSKKFDRKDAQVGQGGYDQLTFQDLKGAKDAAHRFINSGADPNSRQVQVAEKNFQEIFDEIKKREKEALNAGLLSPIDSFVHNDVRPEFDKLKREVALSKKGLADVEAFIQGLKTADLSIIPNLNPIPSSQQDRLDGILDFRLEKKINPILGDAGALRDKLKPQIPNQASQPNVNLQPQSNLAADVKAGFSAALKENKLSWEDSYRTFQSSERWTNRPANIDPNATYWLPRNGEANGALVRRRELMGLRAEIATGCSIKRNEGSLESLAKVYNALTPSETGAVHRMPGVKEAMMYYMGFVDNAEQDAFKIEHNGKKISISEAKDRDTEIEEFRDKITHYLETQLGMSHSQAIDSEQSAFNLLFIGNTFEPTDSVWVANSDGTYDRTRGPKMAAAEFVVSGIKTAMKPMDAALRTIVKGEEEFKEVGGLGKWIKTQGAQALANIGEAKFDYVVCIPYQDSRRKQCENEWWTAKKRPDGKVVLYVPDFYAPVEMVGSVWDETSIDNRPLMDFIRNGEDIPWDKVPSDMWANYGSKLKALDTKWKYLQADDQAIQLNAGVFGGFGGAVQKLQPWAAKINKGLADLKERNNDSVKRWIVYADTGVDPDSRLPKVNVTGPIRDRLNSTLKGMDFISEQPFFPWDRPHLLRKIIA